MQGTANGGYKRGIKYSVCGIFGGIIAKYAEEFLYTRARTSWLNYRRLTIEESRPRILEVKPKMRRPKEGEFFSAREVVTLGTDSWPTYNYATKSKETEHYTTTHNDTSAVPQDKR